MKHRSADSKAMGPFMNRSQSLAEAKFPRLLTAIKATNTHVPQRKTPDGMATAR